jgi:nucleotide-binding universal stress UspA family protein
VRAVYKRILVPLDATEVDDVVLPHVRALAHAFGSEVLLLRVAHYHTRDQRSFELSRAEEYLDCRVIELTAEEISVRGIVAPGEVVDAIIDTAQAEDVDLIAMAGHGHSHIAGWVLGSTIEDVRHRCCVPMLLVRGPSGG